MALIDISQPLRGAVPVWPGEPAFAYSPLARIGPDCPVNTGALALSTHTGTHADAPLHYANGQPDSAGSDLAPYVGPCQVVDARHARGAIRPADFDWTGLDAAERVLFRTYDAFPHDRWDEGFTAITAETIKALAARGIILVGTDAASLDPMTSKTMDAHHAVLRHDMRILEGLVLDGVEPGAYELIALPLRIEGSDSSPVRAVLRTLP